MKSILLSTVAILILCSCSGDHQQSLANDFKYSKSSIETLKEFLRFICKENVDAESAFLRKNQNEIIKTLEVLEEVEAEKDVSIVFYRYSVGTTMVKNTMYLRKMDHLFYPYFKYYSKYDNDPFHDGKGETAKKLLDKAEEWKSGDKIWWSNRF